MNKITTMKEILNERLSEEDIIKLVSNYDNKFSELEKENKEQKKEIERLNNKREKELQDQLQQKEKIIKEVREKLINSKEYQAVKSLGLNSKMSILIELEEILEKEKDRK